MKIFRRGWGYYYVVHVLRKRVPFCIVINKTTKQLNSYSRAVLSIMSGRTITIVFVNVVVIVTLLASVAPVATLDNVITRVIAHIAMIVQLGSFCLDPPYPKYQETMRSWFSFLGAFVW